jgi:GntR family transcriptional repressor for pyruvate dehydrogenase complex
MVVSVSGHDTRATADGGHTGVFQPMERSQNLSERVADAVTAAILAGEMKRGERLPSERALCEQFMVSRSVVREAVRSLVAKGLVVVQPRVGHVVMMPGASHVTESLKLYVRGRGVDVDKVMDVRGVIEVEIAARAAAGATDDDLRALAQAASLMNDATTAEEAAVADVEFHRAIAAASENEFFEMMLDSLRGVLLELQMPSLAEPKTREYVQGAHAAILARIESHDVEGARVAMRDHLREAAARLAARPVEK